MMNNPLIEYTLLAFGSLFVIVDPFATVPAFLAMTPRDTPEQRVRMARLASIVMAAVLLIFNIVLPRRAEQAALRRLARREALGESHDTAS